MNIFLFKLLKSEQENSKAFENTQNKNKRGSFFDFPDQQVVSIVFVGRREVSRTFSPTKVNKDFVSTFLYTC